MTFQDLFARYREMGAMAPQQSLDEQLFKRTQNTAPNSWVFYDAPLDPNMDLPSPDFNGGTKGFKERIKFKLPSPNNFQPFLMSMDGDHEQHLSRDEEVVGLLRDQPSPPQQGWNLGLLKTNNLCKDYYKLTSNMIHTLIMGIKEFADGEISPAWQIASAEDKAHQKQSNLSNMFLQDIPSKPAPGATSPGHGNHHNSPEPKKGGGTAPDPEISSTMKPSMKPSSGGEFATSQLERPKDMDGILELRRLLWRQIVPYTCLGASTLLAPKPDVEKKMKVMQDTRMKVVNAVGFAASGDNNNSAFQDSCQDLDKLPPKGSIVAMEDIEGQLSSLSSNEDANVRLEPLRVVVKCIEPKVAEEDRVKEDIDVDDTSQQEPAPTDTKKGISFEDLEEEGVQLEQDEYFSSTKVKERKPVKRGPSSANIKETSSEEPASQRSFHPAFKETNKAFENQELPTFDGEFEIVRGEIEGPIGLGSPKYGPMQVQRVEDGSVQNHPMGKDLEVAHKNHEGKIKRRNVTWSQETVVPPRSTTRSWCVVGGFTTRSRTILKNLPNPRKPAQLKV